MNKQNGYSILEMVITLAISIPCLLGLTFLLNQSTRNLISAKDRKNKVYSAIRLKQQLETIMSDLDKHPFHLLPRIHKSGNIRNTNNTPNKVLSHVSSLRPSKQSDAISYLELNLLATQQIISAQINSNEILSYSCSRFSNIFSQNDYVGYLLLSSNGFHEALGTVTQVSTEGSLVCLNMTLQPTESIIGSPLSTFNGVSVFQIIPIKSIYTLYIDNKDNLRYLGHKGTSNIENQPIVNKLGNIKIESSYIESNRFIKLAAELTDPKTDTVTNLVLNNNISRNSFLNFLINQP